MNWQWRPDSNRRMPGSKPGALPLGYATILHDKRPPYYGVKAARGSRSTESNRQQRGLEVKNMGSQGKHIPLRYLHLHRAFCKKTAFASRFLAKAVNLFEHVYL